MDYQLSKITTVYSDQQDRVRLLGDTDQGTTCEIWLSNRLLNRLVEALMNNTHSDDFQSDAVQAFQHEAASAALEPQAPVQAQQQPVSWLAQSIDVNRGNGASSLLFKDDQDCTAVIAFSDTELRQWLSIVFQAYQNAQWPLAVWPTWFQQLKTNPTDRNPDAVH